MESKLQFWYQYSVTSGSHHCSLSPCSKHFCWGSVCFSHLTARILGRERKNGLLRSRPSSARSDSTELHGNPYYAGHKRTKIIADET